ncbi:MAG: hypothetical protein ACYSWZ_05405 [Planctomycetota bacterium]
MPEESFSAEYDFADIFSSHGAGFAIGGSYQQDLGVDAYVIVREGGAGGDCLGDEEVISFAAGSDLKSSHTG